MRARGVGGVAAGGELPSGTVSNDELATMAANTMKGNATAGVAAPTDLTAAQSRLNIAAQPGSVAVVDDGNSSTADTIDFSANPHHKSTMTGACTYTFTAPAAGVIVTLRLVQDATGGRIATFPGTVIGTPVYDLTAAGDTTLTFLYNGTSYLLLSAVRTTILEHSSATLTLTAAHRGAYIRISVACTVTVPSGVFGTGDLVDFVQTTSGQVTLVGSGVTLNTPETLKLRKQWSCAQLMFVSGTVADLRGDLELTP